MFVYIYIYIENEFKTFLYLTKKKKTCKVHVMPPSIQKYNYVLFLEALFPLFVDAMHISNDGLIYYQSYTLKIIAWPF
jgi:hypothetical protein